ncbi:MAG: rod shape-determining protein MreD [Balneola sp.]
MRNNVLKHIAVGVIFVLSQLLLFQYLTIFGALADPLLVFCLWLALRYKRFEVLLFVAGLGLFQDALFDTWGLNMFTKTVTIFLTYRFISRNSEIKLLFWQVFALIFSAAFVHNLFYLGFTFFLDTYQYPFSPVIMMLGNSLYTAIIGSILYILKGDSN